MAGHVVGDQRRGNAVLLQLPDRQPRALQERAGFIGEHVDFLARRDRRADHAERGAVSRGGQRAGIAVGEHGLAVGNERRAVAADGLVDRDVFVADRWLRQSARADLCVRQRARFSVHRASSDRSPRTD